MMLFAGFEAVLQTHGAIEDQMAGDAVLGVGAEVTQTHELVGSGSLSVFQTLLHLTAGENLQGVGIQAGQIVLACGIGIGIVEEVGILTYLGISTVVALPPASGHG